MSHAWSYREAKNGWVLKWDNDEYIFNSYDSMLYFVMGKDIFMTFPTHNTKVIQIVVDDSDKITSMDLDDALEFVTLARDRFRKMEEKREREKPLLVEETAQSEGELVGAEHETMVTDILTEVVNTLNEAQQVFEDAQT